jgi:kumamolisin
MQQGNPTLPTSISSLVASVVGLDNFALPQFKPPFPGLLTMSAQHAAQSGNCAGYGGNSSLTRNQIAGAYQVNQLYQQGFQGQGMTIGVAEFGDPYDPQDIANYAACAGITPPNIQNVNVVGNLAPASGEGEAAMDLELISGLAPQATILDYQADTSNTSFAQAMVDVFDRVATDHRVQVLSVSYGTYESSFSASELAAVNRSLLTLAEEGISVFISSGDCGAFAERIHNVAQVSFPSSAPYAIAVGGTHLLVNSSNVRTSETAWGQDDGLPTCSNDWGSGGGVSQNSAFTKPSWQTGTGTTTQYNGGPLVTVDPGPLSAPVVAPNGLRQVPDVAAAAYPNLSIYYKGSWVSSGGTSAAAPIWAAGTLLVDQGLGQKSKAPIGGVPEFYTLANHAGSFHPYNDITSGGNLFYNATTGWDYVTGWGSPNFNDILQLEASLQG